MSIKIDRPKLLIVEGRDEESYHLVRRAGATVL
jgi:hypothetical protein